MLTIKLAERPYNLMSNGMIIAPDNLAENALPVTDVPRGSKERDKM